jgi:hypothetical protein
VRTARGAPGGRPCAWPTMSKLARHIPKWRQYWVSIPAAHTQKVHGPSLWRARSRSVAHGRVQH